MDAQWIEVAGVIRRVELGWHVLDLEVDLENGVGRMLVHIPDGSDLNITVDSTVRLQGETSAKLI
jgi:hypothetical protein